MFFLESDEASLSFFLSGLFLHLQVRVLPEL